MLGLAWHMANETAEARKSLLTGRLAEALDEIEMLVVGLTPYFTGDARRQGEALRLVQQLRAGER